MLPLEQQIVTRLTHPRHQQQVWTACLEKWHFAPEKLLSQLSSQGFYKQNSIQQIESHYSSGKHVFSACALTFQFSNIIKIMFSLRNRSVQSEVTPQKKIHHSPQPKLPGCDLEKKTENV